jgi:adenylylsulfate kinase-like enzyme
VEFIPCEALNPTVARLTGIWDPYESLTDPDLVIGASATNPDVAADQILTMLFTRGYFDTAV